jgi:hypothetical protein
MPGLSAPAIGQINRITPRKRCQKPVSIFDLSSSILDPPPAILLSSIVNPQPRGPSQ